MEDKELTNNQELEPKPKISFLKKLLKILGIMAAAFLILGLIGATLGSHIGRLFSKSGIMKPSIVRITLPQNYADDKEPFDIYIGSQHIDGSGEYAKLTKVSDTVWEGKNTFGEEEKDLDDWMVLKVRKSDQEAPKSVASQTEIQARINKEEFQRGALIVDYWSKDWGDSDINQTNSELKKSNVNWTFLAPVWDMTSVEPLKIWNDEGGTIQYNEEQLKNHIKKLRADGIEVMMGSQLCCTPQPSNFEGKTAAWWDDFFAQYENYMLYHAKIAQESGVKVFVMSFPSQSLPNVTGAPADAEKRFEKLYEKVRNAYNGKLALFDYVGGGAFDEGAGVKSHLFKNDLKIYEKFDLFAVSLWNQVSRTDNPSQEELDTNVAKILDEKVKNVYDKYKKPIIMQTAYRSADGCSFGTAKYSVDLISKNPDWEEYVEVEVIKSGLFKSTGTLKNIISIMIYDAREQAMIYESIYKAVAERDWITGVYPFVYHMKGFDFPRHPDYDIRRKPAENIIADWYARFKEHEELQKDQLIFEKDESWGECASNDPSECHKNTKIYSSGKMIVIEGKKTKELRIDSSGINQIKSQIRNSDIFNKTCEPKMIMDYWVDITISLDDKIKKLTNQACEKEIEPINKIMDETIKDK